MQIILSEEEYKNLKVKADAFDSIPLNDDNIEPNKNKMKPSVFEEAILLSNSIKTINDILSKY